MKFRIKLFCLIISYFLIGENAHGQADSSTFAYEEYIENIILYHPIAQKAELRLKAGEIALMNAKGGFDPILYSDLSEKQFDGKLYYRRYQTKLIIPTPIGIDIVGGYANAVGDYLNPENNLPNNGLWHVGAEINILQGLIVNDRKMAMKQAQVYQDLSMNEQQLILNELLYNASSAYLQWQQYHYFNTVLIENLELAKTYSSNTKQSFLGGDKTSMDTLEAHIMYQDAALTLQKNRMALIKSRLQVANYLWFENTAVGIQQNTYPDAYDNEFMPQLNIWTDTISAGNNPIILASLYKLSMLEIEQKLKREKLKPKLKLKYNPLISSSTANEGNFLVDNYTWGFVFSMPLFLRSERASIQQGKMKIQELEYDIRNKRNELQNKIENAWQQQFILRAQLVLLNQNVQNYKILLDGENEKFNYGESSVFLLNKRQEKYIDAELKLIESHTKQQLERLNYLYYSNQLINDNIN